MNGRKENLPSNDGHLVRETELLQSRTELRRSRFFNVRDHVTDLFRIDGLGVFLFDGGRAIVDRTVGKVGSLHKSRRDLDGVLPNRRFGDSGNTTDGEHFIVAVTGEREEVAGRITGGER